MKRETTDDLQVLMLRLADGDRAAFEPLYEALWPLVRGLAERMLSDSPEAEDAAQEAMTKVFTRASLFDPSRDARAWVLGVTAYECRTLRRKRLRRREHSALDASHADAAATPEDTLIARDFEAAALEVLGSLRPLDREVLAAVLGGSRPDLPQATFRKRVERALARLRAAWSSRHGTD